jgi:hypothetical protein
MSNAAKWKEEAVKVLEDMKHRPSAEARGKAERLLACANNDLTLGQAGRRVQELTNAIKKYDRNSGRR